jgi:hypothetical protein
LNGRIRGQLVAWLVLLALAFSPVSWGFVSNSISWGLQEREILPLVCTGVVLLLLAFDLIRGRTRWYLVAWFGVAAIAFARFPWTNPPFRQPMPVWFWQVALVGSGVALALRPLLDCVRNRRVLQTDAVDDLGPDGPLVVAPDALVLAPTGMSG